MQDAKQDKLIQAFNFYICQNKDMALQRNTLVYKINQK